jgi:hypothetical protein
MAIDDNRFLRFCIEIVDGRHVRVHIFHLDTGNKYRAILSSDAFRKRMSELAVDKGAYHWYFMRNLLDWETDVKAAKRVAGILRVQYEPLPQMHHKTLWDFYKAIGWDHKKKAFTKGGHYANLPASE